MKSLGLLLAAFLLFGCGPKKHETPITPAPGDLSTISGAATGPSEKLSFTVKKSTQEPPAGGYWQVISSLPLKESGTLAEKLSDPSWKTVGRKIQNWFFSTNTELMVTAQVKGITLPKVPALEIYHVQSSGTISTPTSARLALLPPLRTRGDAEVTISVVRSKNVNSNIVLALADTLSVALPELRILAPLSDARKTSLDNLAATADGKLASALSQTQSPTPQVQSITPFATDLPAIDSVAIYLGEDQKPENLILEIKNQFYETLIAGSRRIKDIPNTPVEIKAQPLGGTKTIDQLFREAAPQPLIDKLAKDDRDSLQTFCKETPDVLTQKLGLSLTDQLAVMWMYMSGTNWWSNGEARPTNLATDRCLEFLKPLQNKATSPIPQLVLPQDPVARYEDSAAQAKDWAGGEFLRCKKGVTCEGIPAAIQTSDKETRKAAWLKLLGDQVMLGSKNGKLDTVLDISLTEASTKTVDTITAAEYLANLKLVWKASPEDCWTKVSTQTTRLSMRANPACIRLGETPMPVVFTTDGADPPKLTAIQFWAN